MRCTRVMCGKERMVSSMRSGSGRTCALLLMSLVVWCGVAAHACRASSGEGFEGFKIEAFGGGVKLYMPLNPVPLWMDELLYEIGALKLEDDTQGKDSGLSSVVDWARRRMVAGRLIDRMITALRVPGDYPGGFKYARPVRKASGGYVTIGGGKVSSRREDAPSVLRASGGDCFEINFYVPSKRGFFSSNGDAKLLWYRVHYETPSGDFHLEESPGVWIRRGSNYNVQLPRIATSVEVEAGMVCRGRTSKVKLQIARPSLEDVPENPNYRLIEVLKAVKGALSSPGDSLSYADQLRSLYMKMTGREPGASLGMLKAAARVKEARRLLDEPQPDLEKIRELLDDSLTVLDPERETRLSIFGFSLKLPDFLSRGWVGRLLGPLTLGLGLDYGVIHDGSPRGEQDR